MGSVWADPCRVNSAMITEQDVFSAQGEAKFSYMFYCIDVRPQMPHSSPLRISAVPSHLVGSEEILCVAIYKAEALSVAVPGCRGLPVMKRNKPPSFVLLCTRLCTAGVKCAVNAVPLGKIWSLKQEEYQLLRRETRDDETRLLKTWSCQVSSTEPKYPFS